MMQTKSVDDKQIGSEKLSNMECRNIAMIVDNCPAHPSVIQLQKLYFCLQTQQADYNPATKALSSL